MRFRSMMAVGSVLVAGALSGCGDDDVTGASRVTQEDLLGAWTMVSSAGQELPASTTFEGCIYTVISEDITFDTDLTFSATSVTSLACDDEEPEPDTEFTTGTYRIRNGRLYLIFTGESFERSLAVGLDQGRMVLSVVQNGQTILIVYERP